MFTRDKWDNGKKRIALNVAALIGWFILLPIGQVMHASGSVAYTSLIFLSVCLPLIRAYSMRPLKEKVITFSSKEETEIALRKYYRRLKMWRWFRHAMTLLMVVLFIALFGWAGALMVCGVFGHDRLQKWLNIRGGKKLAAFIVGSIIVMSGVAFVTGLVA